jgi:hypothetical protein
MERSIVDLPAMVTIQVARDGQPSVDVTLRTTDVAEMVDFLKDRQKNDKALQQRLDAVLRHHIGDAQIGRVVLDSGEPLDVKRIFNKGGAKPASVTDPYDYLKLNWPKNHEHVLQVGAVLGLLGGEANV